MAYRKETEIDTTLDQPISRMRKFKGTMSARSKGFEKIAGKFVFFALVASALAVCGTFLKKCSEDHDNSLKARRVFVAYKGQCWITDQLDPSGSAQLRLPYSEGSRTVFWFKGRRINVVAPLILTTNSQQELEETLKRDEVNIDLNKCETNFSQ